MSLLSRFLRPRSGRAAGSRSVGAARRFAGDRKGTAALEFAIIATPFFVFLLAVIEIAFMFYLGVMIDAGALDAARKVRTGQMQFSGASADDFYEEVCDNISIVAPCEGRLSIDVRTYTDFSNTDMPDPVENGEFDPSGLQVDFGEAGDIVIVRVFYVWDVFFPNIGTGLSNLNGNRRLLTSAVTFRNEPFGEIE